MERFAKIPAKQSSRIMPHGFWTFWMELMGKGLRISKKRNRRKERRMGKKPS